MDRILTKAALSRGISKLIQGKQHTQYTCMPEEDISRPRRHSTMYRTPTQYPNQRGHKIPSPTTTQTHIHEIADLGCTPQNCTFGSPGNRCTVRSDILDNQNMGFSEICHPELLPLQTPVMTGLQATTQSPSARLPHPQGSADLQPEDPYHKNHQRQRIDIPVGSKGSKEANADIQTFMTSINVEWLFIPKRAPWCGKF